MSRRIAVIGAGFAGTAAAFRLAQEGAQVRLLSSQTGSSALYSGAADLAPWQQSANEEPLEPELREFVERLGLWRPVHRPYLLATRFGIVRRARTMDRALLDLDALAGRNIGVVDVPRHDWAAELLALSLTASRWAQQTNTRFAAVPVELLQNDHEQRIPAHDFARLHDVPGRVAFLANALSGAPKHDAWLFGPWLGVETDVCQKLAQLLQKPVGETSSAPGGAAGARFEHARDRLLAKMGVSVERAEVTRVEPREGGISVEFIRAQGETSELEAESSILAIGGMAGGGIQWVPSPRLASAFEAALSLEVPVELALRGALLEPAASMHGFPIRHPSAVLEEVGIAASGPRVDGQRRIYVAGDVIAGRPRTALEAVRSGLRAANAVLADRP